MVDTYLVAQNVSVTVEA